MDNVRKNLNERRRLAIINTRQSLVEALYRLEEAQKYSDLTDNAARGHLLAAKIAARAATIYADFGIDQDR